VNGKSLAEMSLEEKNMISHRAGSMKALKQWLESRR
jgi:inosine/xanthosine triphosphate pyrophosphatase family protein